MTKYKFFSDTNLEVFVMDAEIIVGVDHVVVNQTDWTVVISQDGDKIKELAEDLGGVLSM